MQSEKKKFTRDECIALLVKKQIELTDLCEDRYPRRSDFGQDEVVAIKAYLGPWPRALEAAGLKEARSDDRILKNREKRIRAARRKTAAKIAAASEKGLCFEKRSTECENAKSKGKI